VLKVCSPDILHKTEHGGVVLGVDAARLAAEVTAMRGRFPGQAILVEEQVRIQGSECIVGALVDEEFGPAVMVGAGGILTELYRDIAFRLAPCSVGEAHRMIAELKIAPLFKGFRGITLDAEGLARTIAAVADLTLDLGTSFSQLDLNPLGFVGDGWVTLDAKLVLGAAASGAGAAGRDGS